MINEKLLAELLKEYDIQILEKHIIYSYLKNIDLDYMKSPVLRNYLKSFRKDNKLFLEASALSIRSLKELENYLELLIPAEDRKINGAFFTPTFIIDFIVNKIKPSERDKNLDSSCGCAAFLVGLVEYYRKTFNKKIKAIVRENIFGADILDYNIRRTKILLSILALQGSEILDEEDFNLILQDSLRANWKKSFKRNPEGSFDNVVGNPPYVKFQDLSHENRAFLTKHWETIKNGTFNLYFAFFELGYNLLDEDGELGYITPNNYFTSLAGKSLRKYFQDKRCLKLVIDFNHKKVFDAQTYTALTFLNKKKNNAIYYDRISEDLKPIVFLQRIKASPNKIDELSSKKWRLLKTDEQKNIRQIEAVGTPLGTLLSIAVGVATLKDELYFLDGMLQENGYYRKYVSVRVFRIEKEITRSIYKISDFKSQEECKYNTRKIIFPYKVINGSAVPINENEIEKKFPECHKYFLAVKDLLKTRDKGKNKIEPFYAYGRTQGLTKVGKKILTPTFSRYPRFMIVDEEDAFFCNGYGLFFKEEDPTLFPQECQQNKLSRIENVRLVQIILNSYVMHYYISKTSVSIEGGYPCYQKNFIEKFTIPNFTDDELNTLEKLSDPKEIDIFLIKKYQLDLTLLESC